VSTALWVALSVPPRTSAKHASKDSDCRILLSWGLEAPTYPTASPTALVASSWTWRLSNAQHAWVIALTATTTEAAPNAKLVSTLSHLTRMALNPNVSHAVILSAKLVLLMLIRGSILKESNM